MNKTKTCSKCGEVKLVDCFSKQKGSKGGLRNTCKSCDAEQSRKYYESNKAEVIERKRKYRKANPEKVAESSLKWRKANPEKVAETRRNWQRANPEKVAESSLKWRKANPEKERAKKLRRRARKAGAAGNCTVEQLKARFDYYGNKCYNCGSDEKLHADHRIPLSRGGSNHPANIIPLCRSCNSSKGTKTETEFKSQTQQETTHTH